MHKFNNRIKKLESTGNNKQFFLMLFEPHSLDNFYNQLNSIGHGASHSGTIVLMDGLSLISPLTIKYDPMDVKTFKSELLSYGDSIQNAINELEC